MKPDADVQFNTRANFHLSFNLGPHHLAYEYTLTGVEAQELVIGQKEPVTVSGAKDRVTLSGVPVGSNPAVIHWVAG